MNGFSLLLPDFAMIAAGFAMVRTGWLSRHFWEGCEKLVYFVFFPALLFAAIIRSDFASAQTALMVQAAMLALLASALLAMATRFIPGLPPKDWASALQCSFRFNSYVAFAVASRFSGSEGLALMAVLVGFGVPIANVLAVGFLANTIHPIKLLKELAKNPLIIATVSGIVANLMSLPLPEEAFLILERAGSASIGMGLLCVGAGLTLQGIWTSAGIWQAGVLTTIKLVIFPLMTLGFCALLGVQGLQRDMAVLFATMPTASSAYILAVRMGGNGPLVAGLISISTFASMATITIWFSMFYGR